MLIAKIIMFAEYFSNRPEAMLIVGVLVALKWSWDATSKIEHQLRRCRRVFFDARIRIVIRGENQHRSHRTLISRY